MKDDEIILLTRKIRRMKTHVGHFTNGHKLPKTKEVQDAIWRRIRRKEFGEKERVNKLKEKI